MFFNRTRGLTVEVTPCGVVQHGDTAISIYARSDGIDRLRNGQRRRAVATLAVFVLAGWFHSSASGADFDNYSPRESFSLPGSAGPFDSLPDGRLVALSGAEVLEESCAGARVFDLAGTLPDADFSSFGASFFRVSPNGTQVAIGNGGGKSFGDFEIGIFSYPELVGTWFSVKHFEATWYDDILLAVTAGDFGSPSVVTMFDTTSPAPDNPINTVVIDGIGGGSGGIAFDSQGNLFTGNGFRLAGPSATGTIKAFDHSSWSAALTGDAPLDFETEGIFVGEILSASPLALDHKENLLVGGGDFDEGDQDYVAIVSTDAVETALSGGEPVDRNDSQQVRRVDPDPDNKSNFFSVDFNEGANEILIADGLVYAFAPTICTTSGDCDDGSEATDDYCTVEGFCVHVPGVRADIAGPSGGCNLDGDVNIFDIFAVLDAFVGQETCCADAGAIHGRNAMSVPSQSRRGFRGR